MMITRLTVAAVLGMAVASVAHANRPLNTDTADTIAPQRCQFEPYAFDNRSSGVPTERGSVWQLNCGVSGSTQLGTAYARSNADSETAQAVAFGGKTNFVELKDGQTGMAVGYGLNVAKAGSSSWAHDASFAYLIATRELVPGLLGHVNLGWSHSRSARQNSTTWAAAFEWSVAQRVVLSAETYGNDHERPWLGTGLWWGLRENFSVNLSLGVQNANPRVRQATAGFNFEF